MKQSSIIQRLFQKFGADIIPSSNTPHGFLHNGQYHIAFHEVDHKGHSDWQPVALWPVSHSVRCRRFWTGGLEGGY